MQKYTDFTELPIIYRGDDEATMLPYGGVAVFRDGRLILASHYRGRLAMVGADGLVISTCDPLNGHIAYDKLICYGIALHTNEQSLYMLLGEEGSNELYISTIEIIPSLPVYQGAPSTVWNGSEREVVGYSDSVFRWVPSSDVRLPSIPARSSNYQDYENSTEMLREKYGDCFAYPQLKGFIKEEGPEGDEVLTPAGPFEWDVEKHEPKDVPDNFCWDETAYWDWQPFDVGSWKNCFGYEHELTNPSLGPIIIDYPVFRPQIISMGSRVMVSCTHAQLFYCNWVLDIPYQEIEGGLLGELKEEDEGGLRQTFFDWLLATLQKVGLVHADGTPDDIVQEVIGPSKGEHWLDVLHEGFWWWVDEDEQMIHCRISFQDGRPVSSIVTVHPDLGTIDGLFHVSAYYPIAHMFSEHDDITLFMRDTVSTVSCDSFNMSGSDIFWEAAEFGTNYMDNTTPTPIDMDFYLRMLEYFLVQYKRYSSSVNPMEYAKVWKDMYKSKMTWEDPLFSQYTTVDEAALTHEPSFV